MSDKPRLIWHSNSPLVGTGYGQQTALFLPPLAKVWDVTCSAYYGVEGAAIPWNSIPILPGIGSTYGNECLIEHTRATFGSDLRAGLVVSLMDVWVLDPRVWSKVNHAAWCPVDHEPAPGPVRAFFEDSGSIPIAMSKFGQRMLEDLDPLYVPHAIDAKTLRPIDKAEAREETGMPEDAFIVGMVAANKGNPSRKAFDEAFQAFAAFHKKHPESRLYLHTELTGRFQGVDLRALMQAVGLPEGVVISCDQYRAVHLPFPQETMANIYSGLDVLLSPSHGEGFGLCVLEANACGVPAIVSDFSAQPEVCQAGWTVSGEKWYTAIGSWQFKPDIADIIEALEMSYRNRGNPNLAKKAREGALKYDIEVVMRDHMLPALEEARRRFADRQPIEVAA